MIFSCDVEIEDIEVPRLCLQPFVENMFEHAYDSQHKKIYAFINCRKIKNSIEIVIQDVGRE